MKRIALGFAFICFLGACQSKKSETQTSDTTTVIATDTIATATQTTKEEKLCFEYKFKKDITTVQLVIKGDEVTGKMDWLPWEKDGARGTLKGKKFGNEIKVDYDYMIEGSNQSEEKVFVLEGDKLLEKTGELEDKNGKLVMKDPTKATVTQTLNKVVCQ